MLQNVTVMLHVVCSRDVVDKKYSPIDRAPAAL